MKYRYQLNENKDGLIVTGGVDLKGEVTIPSEGEFEGKTYPVTEIWGHAFAGCKSLTSINIPDSVTAIRDDAFIGCSGLTSISVDKGNRYYDSRENCNAIIESKTNILVAGCSTTIIPDSVTEIGKEAFFDCDSLASINIPDSVTEIGKDAFHGCSALTSIIVDKENRHYDSREGCNAIIESDTNTLIIGCSTTVIPDSVTKIGDWAFWRRKELTSINIPDSVTEIGENAFLFCSGLTSIVIPDSVTEIGNDAFCGCSGLISISVDKGNRYYDSRENCNAIIESKTNTLVTGCSNTIIPDSVTKIGDEAFSWCEELTSINIPNSTKEIGEKAFLFCSGLTSIIIPDSVISIGSCAFRGCRRLASIKIPNSLTMIENSTFEDCSGLISIKIPDSITKIGEYAFYGCSRLNSIVVDNENWHYDSRENCNAIIETETDTLVLGCQSTIIPKSVTIIGDRAFEDCSRLTSIVIPDSVTRIGDEAFRGCSGLTSIVIPDSVTKIGLWAFLRCSGLTSIVVDNENWHYDSRENCNAIIETETDTLVFGCQSTIIPKSVTIIGDRAFEDCSRLTSIVIPDSVTRIDYDAFDGCSGLTSIVIPDSVTVIGSWAFDGCSSLRKIVISDASLLKNAGVPEGVEIVKP